jgi:hypothetical protein
VGLRERLGISPPGTEAPIREVDWNIYELLHADELVAQQQARAFRRPLWSVTDSSGVVVATARHGSPSELRASGDNCQFIAAWSSGGWVSPLRWTLRIFGNTAGTVRPVGDRRNRRLKFEADTACFVADYRYGFDVWIKLLTPSGRHIASAWRDGLSFRMEIYYRHETGLESALARSALLIAMDIFADAGVG